MESKRSGILFEAASSMMCCMEGVRRESAAATADHVTRHWGQVVVFTSGGVVHSVATRRMSADNPACIVVDYDSMDVDITEAEFEKKELGCSLEEFNSVATYLL